MTSASTWTDDRIEALTQLWHDGLSASQIARSLGGVSRNAVIGKVHRLGLSGRAPPTMPGVQRARSPGPERRLAARPVSPALARGDHRPAEAPMEGFTDVLSVTRHACRWPIGDPKSNGFALCGRPATRGAYCAAHGEVAYRDTPRDHLLKLAGLR